MIKKPSTFGNKREGNETIKTVKIINYNSSLVIPYRLDLIHTEVSTSEIMTGGWKQWKIQNQLETIECMKSVLIDWVRKFVSPLEALFICLPGCQKSASIASNYEAEVRLVQNKRRKCRGRGSAQQRTTVVEQVWHREIYFLLLVKTFNFRLSRSQNYEYTKPARHFRGLLQTNS